MRHRSASITLKYNPLILNEIESTLNVLLKHGTPSAPKKAIIYSNMLQNIITIAKKLGQNLNADNQLYKIDHVLIHGQLSHQIETHVESSGNDEAII